MSPRHTAAFSLAPDWVCEVLSPSEGRRLNKQAHWSGEATLHAEPFTVLLLKLATR